jgi:hypothetical protein
LGKVAPAEMVAALSKSALHRRPVGQETGSTRSHVDVDQNA